MPTTAQRRRTTGARRPASARAAELAEETDSGRYEYLTAVLLGVTVGAGVALLLRRGPSGRRPIMPLLAAAGQGARVIGRKASDGASWVRDRAEDAAESDVVEDVRDHVREYVDTARDTIAEAIESELADLRHAIRKRRKRLGL